MNEVILKKLEQKIQDTISNKDDLGELIKLLSNIDDSKSRDQQNVEKLVGKTASKNGGEFILS